MTLTDWAWLGLAAYAIHILEEYSFNWRDWARAVIGLPVTWADFAVTNGLVIVLGIAQAELAATLPLIPLSFAALMLINATFFHVLPVILKRGRFSPGLITAVLLFYPVVISIYDQAARDGVLSTGTIIGSLVIGAVLMATPIVFIRLRDRPYFRQAP